MSSQEDNDLPSESDLRARLVALMGGRAAEELLFHEVTGGASNDFEKATQIATTMVTRLGHGPRPRCPGCRALGPRRRSRSSCRARASNLPSEVQPAATRAIRAILDDAYADACDTLAEHLDTLRRIAAYLVREERLDGDTFAALFDGTIDVPTADGEWRPAGTRPRDWADVVPFRDRRLRGGDGAGLAAIRPAPELAMAPDDPAPAREPAPEALAEPVPISATLADDISAAVAAVPEPVDGSSSMPRLDLASAPDPEPVPVPAAPPPLRARPTAVGRPALSSRIRRATAGWLQVAAVRVAPKDRPAR